MIGQPVALEHVNDAIDAYGFDFIEPPEADLTVDLHAGNVLVELRSFYRGGLDPDDAADLEDQGRRDLAMVLVDPAYDGEAFRLHENHFGESLRDAGWTLKVAREPGATVMLVFIDVFGNELRHLN